MLSVLALALGSSLVSHTVHLGPLSEIAGPYLRRWTAVVTNYVHAGPLLMLGWMLCPVASLAEHWLMGRQQVGE